jgi:hypothetical protein
MTAVASGGRRQHAGPVIRAARACLLLVAAATAGCRREASDGDCLRARDEARNAAMHGEVERASELLEHARELCGPRAALDIQRIGETIEARRKARDKQALVEAKSREGMESPVRRMLDWIKLGVASPELAGVECASRGSDDYGFCQGHRAGDPALVVRYWDGQKEAFRYSYSSEEPLGCSDLGEHRRVRAWSEAGKSYELCEFTPHALRSLSALVVRAPGESTLQVFSQAYLERDRGFADFVRLRR